MGCLRSWGQEFCCLYLRQKFRVALNAKPSFILLHPILVNETEQIISCDEFLEQFSAAEQAQLMGLIESLTSTDKIHQSGN
jgi:hypothetical protein